ncbi:hypothetical protein AAFC00_000903 [Neodothiora populina]|uniref:Integral membrane protein n=1 Tax=Neodothiora populina TaxID=2781224 RepID=A0ABR3PM52_9PEZI
MDPDTSPPAAPNPGILRYVLGFLLVGAAWGLTTPFMRKAALSSSPSAATLESRRWLTDDSPARDNATGAGNTGAGNTGGGARLWIKRKVWTVLYAVGDVLRRPAYAVPLVVNLTGSIWFFLLIGQAELSLTVPITNSLAFLFTVLGEWWADGKVISRDTWLGIAFVLGGITLCVHAKNT